MPLNESTVEDAALEWFGELHHSIAHGPEIAPGEPGAERGGFDETVLMGRLAAAVERLNPGIPTEARDEAVRKVLLAESPPLVGVNHRFHLMPRDGVEVRHPDGRLSGETAAPSSFHTDPIKYQ